MQPEVVVVDALRLRRRAGRGGDAAQRERLAALGARVVAVDAAAYFSRPGPRLVDGVELLGHLLHPDLVPAAADAALDRDRPRARRPPSRRLSASQPDDRSRAPTTAIDADATASAPSTDATRARPPARRPRGTSHEQERARARRRSGRRCGRRSRCRGSANVISRLRPIQMPQAALHRVRCRGCASPSRAAPIRPKIAPEAPTVSAVRVEQQRAERAREQRHEVDEQRSAGARSRARAACRGCTARTC